MEYKYRNGREAKNGDKVVLVTKDGPVIGVLYDALAGGTGGKVAPIVPDNHEADLVHMLHVDDAMAALAGANVLPDPVPPPRPEPRRR